MRFHRFRLPRTLLGAATALALGLSVAGSSAHDHALDDGPESGVSVCVVAGTAVLPATPVSDVCAAASPPVDLYDLPTGTLVAGDDTRRSDRARAPPVVEFVIS